MYKEGDNSEYVYIVLDGEFQQMKSQVVKPKPEMNHVYREKYVRK